MAHSALDLPEHRTRQRMLEIAVRLLAERGLSKPLLPDVAAAVQCSLERATIYFRRDEEMVFALYARIAADFSACIPELPVGTIADRFRAAMRVKLELVEPYREAFGALIATLLDPRHELGVLSSQTEMVRNSGLAIFSAVVSGATDAKKDPSLPRTLYSVHLALILLWTQDRSPMHASVDAAIELACGMLDKLGTLSWFPGFRENMARLETALQPLHDTPVETNVDETARAILTTLMRHRRLLPDSGRCAETPCEQCMALHLPKVRRFVRAAEPLHLLLPAFPAKSPCLRKVLGVLPDMAEEMGLSHLAMVCAEIQRVYAPGARLTICSDGHVFSDLVGVPDDHVDAYGARIVAMIQERKFDAIDHFSMKDLYENLTYAQMRENLVNSYARQIESIDEQIKKFEHHRAMFNGIHRFLFEEIVDQAEVSRSRAREQCKPRAMQVIQRSEAWGKLIAECFPTSLRLSIHPQHPHAEKIGILLGAADDVWITPWHGVALRHAGGWKLMRRDAAEATGAQRVDRDGVPNHFELDGPL